MNPRILVVDDNADNRFVIQMAMEFAGYPVDAAGDGYEALQRARDRPPAVVLLDLMMPRMDGWDTIRQLQDMEWERPPVVIAVTARTDPGLREKLQAHGFSGYVSKPFTLDHLIRVVELATESGTGSGWIELQPGPFRAP